MKTPLKASSTTIGEFFSNSRFLVPQYQREYSWQKDEVRDFYSDLQGSIENDTYFLGLVILTQESVDKNEVVDGQQRIVTLSLLCTALYFEAVRRKRQALADKIRADFLEAIDYETDKSFPRVVLSDQKDHATFEKIQKTGEIQKNISENDTISYRISEAFKEVKRLIAEDISSDPFKKLGRWTEFLTNRVYFAVFIHPDKSSAYQVFEVINTRGRDLTTADLLKSYVLSQMPDDEKEETYRRWRDLSQAYAVEGSSNTFVQFIRHSVTVSGGHILPRALFSYLAGRERFSKPAPPTPSELLHRLEQDHPRYQQIIDPSLAGPASYTSLLAYAAFNDLGVMTMRPVMLALGGHDNELEGLNFALSIVVRRIVVGNLGTGNVERRFSEAAREFNETQDLNVLRGELSDLSPSKDEFVDRISSRPMSKSVLSFIRRSIIQETKTPEQSGVLHFIWPRKTESWERIDPEKDDRFGRTLTNTFLSELQKRPSEATDNWESFKRALLAHPVKGEWIDELSEIHTWCPEEAEVLSKKLAVKAAEIWFDD